jgi:hypothetical protein
MLMGSWCGWLAERRATHSWSPQTCSRVGLLPPDAVVTEDAELVPLARLGVGHEQLPHAAGAHRAHGPAVVRPPAGEVTDHPYALGTGRPDRERHAFLERAGAEHRPQSLVPALADELQVELTERRQVPVRVVGDLAVRLDAVVGDRCGQADLEDALVQDPPHRVPLTVHNGGDGGRAAAQGADDRAGAVGVHAQLAVGIVGRPGNDLAHTPTIRSGAPRRCEPARRRDPAVRGCAAPTRTTHPSARRAR